MIIMPFIGPFKRAQFRLWIDELPSLHSKPTKWLLHTQDAHFLEKFYQKEGAIEVTVNQGPRIHYGLIGGEFTPQPSSQLIVKIGLTSTLGEKLDWTLAPSSDEVYAGLPEDYYPYHEGILTGLASASELLGAGQLRVNCIAHGFVGSSPYILQKLTTTLVRLLSLNKIPELESELVEEIKLDYFLKNEL